MTPLGRSQETPLTLTMFGGMGSIWLLVMGLGEFCLCIFICALSKEHCIIFVLKFKECVFGKYTDETV